LYLPISINYSNYNNSSNSVNFVIQDPSNITSNKQDPSNKNKIQEHTLPTEFLNFKDVFDEKSGWKVASS